MNALSFIVDTGINAAVNVAVGAASATFATGIATVGVIGSVFSIATGGTISQINEVADFTIEAKSILPCLYMPLLATLNVDFSVDVDDSFGVVTNACAAPIFTLAYTAAKQDSLFEREVVSRISYGLGVIVSAVTRAADLALGLIAAAISIFPLIARAKQVNEFAFCHLLSLGVVNDVCSGFRGMINPQQFVKESSEIHRQTIVDEDGDLLL